MCMHFCIINLFLFIFKCSQISFALNLNFLLSLKKVEIKNKLIKNIARRQTDNQQLLLCLAELFEYYIALRFTFNLTLQLFFEL